MKQVQHGWYPDPSNPSQLRYWDGQQWTDHVQLPPQAPHHASVTINGTEAGAVKKLSRFSFVCVASVLLMSCATSNLDNQTSQVSKIEEQRQLAEAESLYDIRDRAISLIESMALEMNVANEQFLDFKEAESKNMRPITCWENELLWRTQAIVHSPVELERDAATDAMMNAAIKKQGGTLNYVEKDVLADGTTEWQYDIGFPDGFASLILIRAVGVSFSVATPCGVF